MRMLLAGDIGGTNTRLGLFAAASPRPSPVEVRTYETGDFPTLESMLAAFLAEAGAAPASISGAAFGVAGPVVHGRAALTNADWQIDASRVARALGVRRKPCADRLSASAWFRSQRMACFMQT